MNEIITKEKLKQWNLEVVKREDGKIYLMSFEDSDKYREAIECLTDLEVVFMDQKGQIICKKDGADMLDEEDVAPVYEEEEHELIQVSNQMIKDGLAVGASDIHIEPLSDKLRIRFRIDGKLKNYKFMPLAYSDKLLVRLKILAGLDISQKKLPQDGRFFIEDKQGQVDIRLSTSPVYRGEKIVLRLLKKKPELLTMEGLGLNSQQREDLTFLLKQSNGLILFTGPTNSGKTTSIYTLLQEINRESMNIMTIEDPIEYQIEGINQMQVNPVVHMDFTQGLRTMLRQDPDVLMVGEIRNPETAKIAIRAAITGRLIFSTIHTRDAISAVYRLEEMGIQPYYIADGLLGIVAQRLLTTLCPHCKEPVKMKVPAFFDQEVVLYQARGCPHCNQGYLGRKAVFEIILFKDWLVDCVNRGKDLAYMRSELKKHGIPSLKDRITEELLNGTISLDEAYRCLNTI